MLPKFRSLESILQPINRLPKAILILIPHFFTDKKEDHFPTNKSLITMTHVNWSWRNALLSTPSLWTQLDLLPLSQKRRWASLIGPGNNPSTSINIWIARIMRCPSFPPSPHNLYRLQWLEVDSCPSYMERVLTPSTRSIPDLKHLTVANDPDGTNRHRGHINTSLPPVRDTKLPSTIFEGHLPKLISLSLHYLRTNLRAFNFPSLMRFNFTVASTNMSVKDLASFFERYPSLEFIQLLLEYAPQLPTAPPANGFNLPC